MAFSMYGIINLSVIPVRKEPADRSEMVNQLLFGEQVEVMEQHKSWCRIKSLHDNYEGWIDEKQYQPVDIKNFQKLREKGNCFTLELMHPAMSDSEYYPLLIGSTLYDYDGMCFKLGKQKFIYSGQVVDPAKLNNHIELIIEKLSRKYLNAPYLWGGRSPFGIDCSGFNQMVFKLVGIPLPRDAWQQAAKGKLVHFLHEARKGDLAFFEDDTGKIIHTGILLGDGKIIHASGKVHIAHIDHHGIYDNRRKKYTHRLRLIKRFIG